MVVERSISTTAPSSQLRPLNLVSEHAIDESRTVQLRWYQNALLGSGSKIERLRNG
jgi:hypothetical protein